MSPTILQTLTDPITLLWILWLLYWSASALRGKQTVRRESSPSRLAHGLPLLIAAWLLLMHRPDNWLGQYVEPSYSWGLYYTGLALVAIGLAFTVWARVHLGRNWSGTITVKEQHELITCGPYRLVRHPIYTGMLLAFLGTAIAQDQWRSLLALVIVWLALWRKWRVEERFMQETFGDKYAGYCRRVPAVIPWKLPR
ncbi:MAG: methyltransferase family protein [Rhodanobacteraceae bacterium]